MSVLLCFSPWQPNDYTRFSRKRVVRHPRSVKIATVGSVLGQRRYLEAVCITMAMTTKASRLGRPAVSPFAVSNGSW
jgi:hypothetical protein